MQMTNELVYNSLIHGALKVIQNTDILNKINVYPVRDGDTGSNLASMMRSIIHKSEQKATVKKTLESVAEAALYGARGNSGIIFAQYLNGLSEYIQDEEIVSVHDYVNASNHAVQYAYEAVEKPVEGTIITIMREWGKALLENVHNDSIAEIFSSAFIKIEIALEKTKEQLEVLKKAGVVDSGAKGFTYFIEGSLYYLQFGESIDLKTMRECASFPEVMGEVSHGSSEEYRYCTECLIEGDHINTDEIKSKLRNMGNSSVVAGNNRRCRIHIHTNEPSDVFDFLHKQGTVVFQKVDDMLKQEMIVNHRKSNIALVTDSIADLPKDYIDDHQIHIVHLDILYRDIIYMDKLTVQPTRLLQLLASDRKLPTSSQPSPKQIENLLDYLSTYYDSIIVMTVSKELSGTYNNFLNTVKSFKKKDYKISVINTNQNSGAQGLLVKKCSEYIKQGFSHDEIVERVKDLVKHSKILVQIRTLDNMIKSGRLSVRAGYIAKRVGMKPIVTLDDTGKGALDSIAFSIKGSNKKIIQHIQKLLRNSKIEQYSIVHVNNETGAREMAEKMTEIIGFEPGYITETSSIVAVSAGEGAIAVSYLLEREE